MPTADLREPVRVNEPGTRVASRVRDLFRYRELYVNLVRKELKVKYKNSVLGFVWSLLNPAMYLVVFWLVFTKFIGQGFPNFAIFLLSGLLGWNLWSTSLSTSATSLIGNSSLVTKVYFPREVLPLSAIGASLVHFFFQLIVLVVALVVLRQRVGLAGLVLVPSALAVEVVLLAGLCLIVSVLNVYFRDVQHLLELALLAWFWMTPIVYPVALPIDKLGGLWRFLLLNPMTPIALALQRGVYGQVSPPNPNGGTYRVLVEAPATWYLRNVAIVGIGAVVVFAIGWAVFRRLESRLAEEL